MNLREIAVQIVDLEKQMRQLEEEYKKKKADVLAQVDYLQSQCPHPAWKRHPDASGNNDVWDECELCGHYERR
jgi:hypothetical protein